MKLSKQDLRLLHRVRKTEEFWLSLRWVALIVGIAASAAALFLFQRIWVTVAADQILIIVCILAAPASGILLFLSLSAILYTFAGWKGRPTEKLLLKLAKELNVFDNNSNPEPNIAQQ